MSNPYAWSLPISKSWDKQSTGAHLEFSEGKGPNFKKGANQYKSKKKRIKSYIGDSFLIIRSYKIGTHMIVDKTFFF